MAVQHRAHRHRAVSTGPIDTTPACSTGQNIGILRRTVLIAFGGANNLVDCGFVLSSDADVSSDILNLGAQVNNVAPAFVGQAVQKNGRTTSCTEGTVTAVNVTIPVAYDSSCGQQRSLIKSWFRRRRPRPLLLPPGILAHRLSMPITMRWGSFSPETRYRYRLRHPIGAVLDALNVSLASVASSQVLREHPLLFTHGFSSDTNCATLLKAITFNGGVLDLDLSRWPRRTAIRTTSLTAPTPLSKRLVLTGGAPARPVSRPARRVRV